MHVFTDELKRRGAAADPRSARVRWRGRTEPRIAALAAKAALNLGAIKPGWNGYCMLHSAASRVGALDIGFVPEAGGLTALEMADGLDLAFLLGADEIDIAPGAFVVYIGTHGDAGAHRADVILPGAAYTEKSGIYVNTEGRVQIGRARLLPARRRARGLGDPARAVRRAQQEAAVRLAPPVAPGAVPGPSAPPADRSDCARRPRRRAQARRAGGAPDKAPLRSAIDDFYLTNPIARASAVMAECSALAERHATRTAAE